MNTRYNCLLAVGLAMGLLPGFAQAKPSSNCKLDPQEFVYVQLSMGNKLNQLQRNAIEEDKYDRDTQNSLIRLSKAYNDVFDDAGKYGASHDSMSYSPEKLESLRNAAANFYSNYCRKMNCNSQYAEIGYTLQEMAILAVDEFSAQCSKKSRKNKNWVDKWNRIDKGVSAIDVANNRRNSRDDSNSRWVAQNPYDWSWNSTTTTGNTQIVYGSQVQPQVPPSFPPQVPPSFPPGPNGHPHAHPGFPHHQVQCGMDDSSFKQLKEAVKKGSFDKDKLVVMKTAIPYNTFYVSQVVDLLKLMSSDQEKVKIGKVFADRICDCQNWFQVYNAFTFDSNKRSMPDSCATVSQQDIYKNRRFAHGQACGMNEADFNTLVKTLKNSSFDNGKMKVLDAAVPMNTFYTAQATEILKMLDSDQNKVTVGVKLYNQVCDPENWYQVYNAFTFDTNRYSLAEKLGMK